MKMHSAVQAMVDDLLTPDYGLPSESELGCAVRASLGGTRSDRSRLCRLL